MPQAVSITQASEQGQCYRPQEVAKIAATARAHGMKLHMDGARFANAVAAQQVYGGHGYIAANGVEQFVRDARIAMIYEGANGIQALDLVGRKLPRDGGRAVMAFFAEVGAFAKEHGGDEAMKPFVAPLSTSLGHLQKATTWLMMNAMAQPDNAGAAARNGTSGRQQRCH